MNNYDTHTASCFGEKRYYSLNEYCRQTFGEKVYRLSLNAGMSCPNRDGTLATGGCAFCSEGGSGDFAAKSCHSISGQIADARQRISSKCNCSKFIAYFQAYTNTYAPVSYLRRIFTEAMMQDEIVALSIATRSDCLPPEVLELLARLNQIKPVWVELGLQTIHNKTLASLSTHTTFAQYQAALEALKQLDIPVITHLILGLPGEDTQMMMDSVNYVAHSGSAGVKLQLLHVLKNTALARQYERHPFSIFSLEEYCNLIVDCIERLPSEMVIHRITGDGPKNLLIEPKWSTNKKLVLNTIHKYFRERDTWQGKYYQP